jgi:nicotinate-nucleotide adenylyltransferase
LVDAPLVEISSTFIRDGIRDGKEMRAFVPERAYEQILLNGWYR